MEGAAASATVLLRYGADPEPRDVEGTSALEWAQVLEHDELAAALARYAN